MKPKNPKRESIPVTPNPPILWAVMKAYTWDAITIHGLPLRASHEEPQRFIPVFETREQAVAWAGSEDYIAMLSIVLGDKGTTP